MPRTTMETKGGHSHVAHKHVIKASHRHRTRSANTGRNTQEEAKENYVSK